MVWRSPWGFIAGCGIGVGGLAGRSYNGVLWWTAALSSANLAASCCLRFCSWRSSASLASLRAISAALTCLWYCLSSTLLGLREHSLACSLMVSRASAMVVIYSHCGVFQSQPASVLTQGNLLVKVAI